MELDLYPDEVVVTIKYPLKGDREQVELSIRPEITPQTIFGSAPYLQDEASVILPFRKTADNNLMKPGSQVRVILSKKDVKKGQPTELEGRLISLASDYSSILLQTETEQLLLRNPIRITAARDGTIKYQVDSGSVTQIRLVGRMPSLTWKPSYILQIEFGATDVDLLSLSLVGSVSGSLSSPPLKVDTVRVHTQPLLLDLDNVNLRRAMLVQSEKPGIYDLKKSKDSIITLGPTQITDSTFLPVQEYQEIEVKRILFLRLEYGNLEKALSYGYIISDKELQPELDLEESSSETSSQLQPLPIQIYQSFAPDSSILIGSSQIERIGNRSILRVEPEVAVTAESVVSRVESRVESQVESQIKNQEKVESTVTNITAKLKINSELSYSSLIRVELPIYGSARLMSSSPPAVVEAGFLIWNLLLEPGVSSTSLFAQLKS